MTIKCNKSLKHRFSGASGKKRLVDCLIRQQLVAGDVQLARQLCKVGLLRDVRKNTHIIEQGDSDNDLYFIITGSVTVSVNGRDVAKRFADNHFGEMALIDPTARRSASVIALEGCTLLRIPEEAYSNIADKNPNLWRRTAVAISARLRERNKFHTPPHDVPVVFIGSSSEALDAATAINNSLSKKRVITKLWTEGVFQASKTIIEDLWAMAKEADFAVIVLSPDDVCITRGEKKRVPRDNAVFELGLFIGSLGRDRAFIITPSDTDLKIPTDLLGVTCLRYKETGTSTIGRKTQAICKKLYAAIDILGAR